MYLLTFQRHLRRLRNEESGSALVAVIGVLLVSVVIASVVSASAVHAMGYTSATRAGVQSQAAADAGIAAGRVILETGTCAASTITSTDPAYKVTFWTGSGGGGWTKQCPTASSTSVRIISTGFASSKGVAGQGGGDESYEELVLAKEVVQSSGAAVYLGSAGFANAFTVAAPTVKDADVRVYNGNFSCTSSGTYDGDIIVGSGSVRLTNPCTINGNIWAAGEVVIDSGSTINGDVIAANGQFSMNGNGKVTGNVYANGNFMVQNGARVFGSVEATGLADVLGGGKVDGSVLAARVGTISGNVGGNVIATQYSANGNKTTVSPGSASDRRVGGNLTLGGSLESWVVCNGQWNEAGYACGLKANGSIAGDVTLHVSGLVAPTPKAAPVVPGWVDVDYVPGDWYDAGYTQQIKPPLSGNCQINSNTNPASELWKFWTQLNSVTTPTVFDLRDCTEVYFNSGLTLKLKTNVTLILKKMGTNSWKVQSADGQPHQFNVIVPDTSDNNACTCSSADVNFGGGPAIVMSAPIYGMLYAPGKVAVNNGSVWRGQIYAGSMSYSANDKLEYVAVGIPGVNLDNIGVDPTMSAFSVKSSRNRGDDGE